MRRASDVVERGRQASRVVSGLVVALMLATGAMAAGGAPPAYDHGAGAVVLRYRLQLGEMGEADAGPALDVYGDGRCVVHHPRYMARAGDWTLRLSRAELDALLAAMVERGLLAFDARAVRAEQRAFAALRRGRGELHARSDADVVVVELRVNGGARTVRWAGLGHDAAAYPAVGALQDLAAADARLRAILAHDDLRPLGAGGSR